MTAGIEVAGPLTGPAAAAVLDLASAAAAADAVGPLSEHVLLHLRYGGDPQARDLLLHTNEGKHSGDLAGYAHLDLAETGGRAERRTGHPPGAPRAVALAWP